MFKIEIRKNCKICGKKITNKHSRTFCSAACRDKNTNLKRKEYNTEYQRKRNDTLASKPSNDKIQCLVCGRYYIQVCTHAVARHGFKSGREYREYFDLEVKRGVVPDWYRQQKGDQAINNETYKNLKVGKKFWFKPGDTKAGRYHRSPITLERVANLGKAKLGNNKTKYAK